MQGGAAFDDFMRTARPQTALPTYRSKLASVFGTRLAEPGLPLAMGESGFLSTSNGMTSMTPRGTIPGTALRTGPAPPMSPRALSARPSPRGLPHGGYASLGAVDVQPRSPRAATASSTPRDARLKREGDIRAIVTGAQERMLLNNQRHKMKKLLQHIANDKEEVPVSDLLLTAELANVPLTDEQKQLFFTTPLATRYAATYEATTPRSQYGLECSPRSVKWRAFNEALKHSKLQSAEGVEMALKRYADKEVAAVEEQKRRDAEAAALAVRRAEATGKKPETTKGISDEQLRMVHKIVKQRLSTQFSEIRTAFRAFDNDKSGNISAAECTDALMALNVGVPRKWIDHLVNIADYDRDGEINYSEFARILTADDIVSIKKAGAEEEGLVERKWDIYKPGLTKTEMRSAQTKVREMLVARGGLTKMFRSIDEDKSGACSRAELRLLIRHLNLDQVVRPPVLEELLNLMDVDGDDSISFKEFARVVTAGDVFDMTEVKVVEKEEKKKMTKREKRLQQKRAYGF